LEEDGEKARQGGVAGEALGIGKIVIKKRKKQVVFELEP